MAAAPAFDTVSLDADSKMLHLGNFAAEPVDMNHPLFRLLGEQAGQQASSFDMDLQNSMAPWAIGMRDLNLLAQSWNPAMASPIKDVQLPPGMDAWAAIGNAAGKTGLTPGSLQPMQQQQDGQVKSDNTAQQYNQLSLSREQMGFSSSMPSSALNSASDSSTTLTPSTVETASSTNDMLGRQARSVGGIDQSHIPLWLRRQAGDTAQSRFRGQSAPDLHGTYAPQPDTNNDDYASHGSTDRVMDQMQLINAIAAQSQQPDQQANGQASLPLYMASAQFQQGLNQQYLSAASNYNAMPLSQANVGKLDSISPFNLDYDQGNSFASTSFVRPASDPLQQSNGQASKSRRMRGYSNSSKAALIGRRGVSPKSYALEASDHLHTDGSGSAGSFGPARHSKGSISKVSVPKRSLSSDGSDGGHGGDEVQMRHVCPHPGCDKHFSTSGHARRHSRIHDDLRPYECPHADCHATFTRRDNCTQHQRARHGSQLPAQRLGS